MSRLTTCLLCSGAVGVLAVFGWRAVDQLGHGLERAWTHDPAVSGERRSAGEGLDELGALPGDPSGEHEGSRRG